MQKRAQSPMFHLFVLIMSAVPLLISGCGANAAKGAGQGAASGALAGAVGGMATALIFGGNVGDAAARGAVYGGATGAVHGGIAGSNVDRQVAAQQQAERDKEIARFRKEIGTDAFNGFVALAECKHDIAIANAREAKKSRNRDYALAGLWIETLTEADRRNEAAANALLPELASKDREIGSIADAESRMNDALQKLGDIRVENDLPKACRS